MTTPFRPMTPTEVAAFDKSFLAARDKSGGWRSLANALSFMTEGEASISYAGVRLWFVEKRIPAQWALIMDAYCEETSFLALCPYLKPWARKAA